jgi:hypothetical protein
VVSHPRRRALVRLSSFEDVWGCRVPCREPYAAQSRFDDPLDCYAVIYAARTLRGALLEKLQVFRTSPVISKALAKIRNNDRSLESTPASGVVSKTWLRGLRVGRGNVSGIFVDVRAASTIAQLDKGLRPQLIRLRIKQLDLSHVTSQRRAVTQEVSRWVYERRASTMPHTGGLVYCSRFGSDEECWAIFERSSVEERDVRRLSLRSVALRDAIAIHGLQIV